MFRFTNFAGIEANFVMISRTSLIRFVFIVQTQ